MSTPRIQVIIISAYHRFRAEYGATPNTLLVSSNAEMDLNARGIKIGGTFMGMQIVSAEIKEDAAVALILKAND